MTNLPSRYIIAVAVALGALNYLWLAGGNATWVPDQYRGVVKAVALVLALAVFALGMAMTARASSRQWLGTTVAAGSMTAGLGFVLIVASSAVLARGQFFHDGIRLGDLAMLLLAVVVGAAVVAALVGYLSRILEASRSA